MRVPNDAPGDNRTPDLRFESAPAKVRGRMVEPDSLR